MKSRKRVYFISCILCSLLIFMAIIIYNLSNTDTIYPLSSPLPSVTEEDLKECYTRGQALVEMIRDYSNSIGWCHPLYPDVCMGDGFIRRWKVEALRGRVYVTVFRDFDIARATSLIDASGIPQVVVKKAEIAELKPARKHTFGVFGELQATLEPVKLWSGGCADYEAIWRLDMKWYGEPMRYSADVLAQVTLETEIEGAWYTVPHPDNWGTFGEQYDLSPGENFIMYLMTPWYNYDFPKGKYQVIIDFGKSGEYAGEFRIHADGNA